MDIVHPADVLFFLHPIRRWQRSGHRVFVASRCKDVVVSLLDAFDVEHAVISTAGNGLPGLAVELLRRDLALLQVARRFRPDVMCGFGGIAISHVGKLIGRPAISFYDTERAPLQHRLSLPFISHLYVPHSYDGPVVKGRTSRFRGTKEGSYLHPDNFSPDRAIAIDAGLDVDAPNYFIRLVAWQSNHDIGYAGWDAGSLEQCVEYLAQRGRVHISSELPLPVSLQPYRYSGAVQQVHHLLGHCHCYIGESATMASEAVMLGVPAIYAAADRRCYTDELARRQLLWRVESVSFESIRLALESIAGLPRQDWLNRVGDYHRQLPNLADLVETAVLQHGSGHLPE